MDRQYWAMPPSMRMAVKLHQAFLLAARTDHAAGIVPLPSRVLALFLGFANTRFTGPGAVAQATPVGWRASRSGRQARTTVYPCGTYHGPKHLIPCTRRASGTPLTRAHPSNERCLRRFTRRHSGGSRRPRLTHHYGGHAALISSQLRFCPRLAFAPYTGAVAGALAWRRAVELTRSRQSFSSAPSGSSPSFR
jgi:hypothetical protein